MPLQKKTKRPIENKEMKDKMSSFDKIKRAASHTKFRHNAVHVLLPQPHDKTQILLTLKL
jgi:hypothetical protein